MSPSIADWLNWPGLPDLTRLGVGVLHHPVKMKVQRETESNPRSPWQEPGRKIQRYAVEVGAAELAQSDVRQAHQCQRRQKMLAKLPVRHPWLSFVILFQRKRIDEDRPPS